MEYCQLFLFAYLAKYPSSEIGSCCIHRIEDKFFFAVMLMFAYPPLVLEMQDKSYDSDLQ